MSRIIAFFFTLFVFLYPIPYTLYPVHAEVDIGKIFGFGGLKSMAEATNRLITPTFSIAAVIVIIYFLLGAFRYLKAGSNKEEIAGARDMITHAIIGFLILMFAFMVLQFLLSRLFGIVGLQIFKGQ